MSTPTPSRDTMNKKPVIWIPAKGVINMKSLFEEKHLCDGPTFSTGTGCAYSCAFCFVPNQMRFQAAELGVKHEETVIRRKDALTRMREQLTGKGGAPKFTDPKDRRVIYSSPLVDVAANMELCRETADACEMILRLTNWHIRLISKSNLLPHIAADMLARACCPPAFPHEKGITPAEVKERMIFGVSTGTLDDGLAAAFEQGTARVSKRIESLHQLQDAGWRTFGMICPSLPIPGALNRAKPYIEQANAFADAIRVERCEHVWTEVINVRGDSMHRTVAALRAGDFPDHAAELEKVSMHESFHEQYARDTFAGYVHSKRFPPSKLRHLQYVKAHTLAFWQDVASNGAVLLGKEKIKA